MSFPCHIRHGPLRKSLYTDHLLPVTSNPHFPRLNKTMLALCSYMFFNYLPSTDDVFGVPLTYLLPLLRALVIWG